jgi:hypothetical protein
MASTPLLGLSLPADGTTNWGTLVNTSITALIDSAVAGTTTLSSDADVTLTATTEATNQARQAVLLCSGARTAIRTITAPASSKTYIVINNTSGSFGVKIVGVGPTTGVTVPSGRAYMVAWNGSDFVITGITTVNLATDVTGTLPTTNGGTGLTSFTANGVVYASSSSALTTGSALVFDGTNLGIGTPAPAGKLDSRGASYFGADSNNALYVDSTSTLVTIGAAGRSSFSTSALRFLTSDGTAALERMRLDSSGNLGLGVTPSAWQSDSKALDIGAYTSLSNTLGFQAVISNNAYYNSGYKYRTSGYVASALVQVNGAFQFQQTSTSGTAGNAITFTQAMTLDASGNLLVGLTGPAYNTERLTVYKSGNTESAAFVNDAGANNYTVAVSNRATTGDNKFMVFATESSDTTRGSIVYNRGTGLVTYATTSDYRAKDIIGPVQNPGATIDALKVYEGKMKGATQSRPMLVAHEAQAVAQYCVVGEKDAVDVDGDPLYQQMDLSALVPLLLAEIQSLRQRVAQLEGNQP